jgi:Protein of unknown function (DUF1592)/Protein of unknown function (DUF1588)/Protein of unknown function (DUF1595)/Protein of unknown function (DUF1585)/Protein of unknown function (DUF1587)
MRCAQVRAISWTLSRRPGHILLVRTQLAALVLGPALALGCNGFVNGDKQSASPGDGVGAMPGVGGSGGAATGPAAACNDPAALAPGPSPLVRLSATEYRNTLRDLFPNVAMTAAELTLPAEVQSAGFLNTAEAQAPSAAVISSFHDNASAVAKLAVADLTKILPCTATTPADELSCGVKFIQGFGKQALRRPLSADETTRYTALFSESRTQWGFPVAVRLLIQAFLQTPAFLYRLEYGGAAVPGSQAIALDGYQMASRLAYLMTDSTPDAELVSAADAGMLTSPEGLETQARRLLKVPGAREAVASFHAQWLRFDKLGNLTKAPDLYPSFNPAMAAALKDATVRYVDRIFWDEGHTLQSLLTDRHAYVDATLAPLYGTSTTGAELAWTEVDASQRSGILTQAGLMAGLAHERNDAPVQRGVFVLDRLLCQPPPPPLASVNTSLPPLTAASNQTTRQQLEASHNTPTCAACHNAIDGIGFGFGKYDAIGQWRTTQFGQNVDASGELVGTDIDGKFDGAVEMGKKLAESRQVRGCLAAQWLGYALAVRRDNVDACMTEPLVKTLEASNGDLREMVVALVKSNAFRYRPVAP